MRPAPRYPPPLTVARGATGTTHGKRTWRAWVRRRRPAAGLPGCRNGAGQSGSGGRTRRHGARRTRRSDTADAWRTSDRVEIVVAVHVRSLKRASSAGRFYEHRIAVDGASSSNGGQLPPAASASASTRRPGCLRHGEVDVAPPRLGTRNAGSVVAAPPGRRRGTGWSTTRPLPDCSTTGRARVDPPRSPMPQLLAERRA